MRALDFNLAKLVNFSKLPSLMVGWRFSFFLFLFLSSTLGCSSLLYQPSHRLYVHPDKIPNRPEEIHFKEKGGLDIAAWYFKQKDPAAVKARVAFFHGNGENLSSHFMALYWLLEHGYEFLIFDYPGYGISHGDPNPENTVSSGLAAIRWLAAREPQRPLAVFGQSLGGAVALKSASIVKEETPLCFVAVESTFSSYKAAARDLLALHWLTWILQPLTYLVLSDASAPKGHIREISPTPLLVMHGERDKIVQLKRGQEVFSEARAPKEFWTIPKGQHIDAFVGSDRMVFRDRFLKKLKEHCSP